MRPSVWAFDLDMTLLDTAELNRQAYETVGVKIPDSAYGLSWTEWLPEVFGGNVDTAAAIHRSKTGIYLRQLIESDLKGMELPALEVARELYADNPTRVKILTASSILSTRRLMNRLGFDMIEYHAELQYKPRLAALRNWSTHANVTYVDDNLNTVKQLLEDVRHSSAIAGGETTVIHYAGQDLETLKRQMGVPTWTR